MKKFIALALALVMVLSLVACGTSGMSDDDVKKVGLLLPTLQAEFFIAIGDTVEKELTADGMQVSVASFDMDAAKAIECVENFIAQDVDVLLAMVIDNSCDDVLKSAMEAGVAVIACGVETAHYDYLMVADNTDAGNKVAEMTADWVNQNFGGATQIAVMVTHSSATMAERSDALVAKLKELLPNSEIVMEGDVMDVGDGTAFTENLLQKYPDCKVIASYSDAMVIEAVEVYKAAGKADATVGLFGNDATVQALDAIKTGDLVRGSVYMGDVGLDMANAVREWLSGEVESGSIYVSVNTKITADNIADYIS